MSSAAPHGYAEPRPRWGRRILVVLTLLVLVAVAYVVAELTRSAPALSTTVSGPRSARVGGASPRMPWPSSGSAAVEVVGVGSLGSHRGTTPRPLASVTKLMTALVVLKTHPLRAGLDGPTISISAADVTVYRADLASDQSVLQVSAGEQLDERQALEGLLIPSANNVALILARWDAGSVTAFVSRMNAMAASLGLEHTHFVEPSGIAAADVGTAVDMMHLGVEALANPTIASIVGLGEVDLPVAGTVINYDYEVGHHGIIGVKTGSSSAAGGNFVFAARRRVDGKTLTVVGSVLGQGGLSRLQSALDAGVRLAGAAFGLVRTLTVAQAGEMVVRVRAPWSSRSVAGVTTAGVRYFGVPGAVARIETTLSAPLAARRLRSLAKGQRIGTVTITVSGRRFQIPVEATGSLSGPSLQYRLTRL